MKNRRSTGNSYNAAAVPARLLQEKPVTRRPFPRVAHRARGGDWHTNCKVMEVAPLQRINKMAARPLWKGQLRLSLVAMAVELYSATKTGARVSFRQIHE